MDDNDDPILVVPPVTLTLDIVKAHLAELAAVGPLEDVCMRCGRCCHFTAPGPNGRKVRTPEPCPHLKLDGECACYETRLEVAWCVPLAEAIVKGDQPTTCPYVRGLRGYRGPA